MANLKDRYTIAPQMQDYDRLSTRWRPYMMFFNQPNIALPSVTTDDQGFRRNIAEKGPYGIKEFSQSKVDKGIILGGSAAFGVGATHDQYTIASLLNGQTQLEWYNFGGRAFNSTQELILFLLYSPLSIKKLILFSGINNLSIAAQLQCSSPVFPPFYFQSRFEKGMALESEEVLGIKYRLVQLKDEIIKKYFSRPLPVSATPALINISDNLAVFERDMKILKALSKVYDFKIFFFLQPFAWWIDKELTREEQQIFDILDHCANMPALLSKRQHPDASAYVEGIHNICKTQDIPFQDLNEMPEFKANRWLFVDRVHLTDEGYTCAAQIIQRYTASAF